MNEAVTPFPTPYDIAAPPAVAYAPGLGLWVSVGVAAVCVWFLGRYLQRKRPVNADIRSMKVLLEDEVKMVNRKVLPPGGERRHTEEALSLSGEGQAHIERLLSRIRRFLSLISGEEWSGYTPEEIRNRGKVLPSAAQPLAEVLMRMEDARYAPGGLSRSLLDTSLQELLTAVRNVPVSLSQGNSPASEGDSS